MFSGEMKSLARVVCAVSAPRVGSQGLARPAQPGQNPLDSFGVNPP